MNSPSNATVAAIYFVVIITFPKITTVPGIIDTNTPPKKDTVGIVDVKLLDDLSYASIAV